MAKTERRSLACEHADQLRLLSAVGLGEPREHCRERVRGLAPCEHPLLDEADGLAAAKATLGVIARCRCNRARAHARDRPRRFGD